MFICYLTKKKRKNLPKVGDINIFSKFNKEDLVRQNNIVLFCGRQQC